MQQIRLKLFNSLKTANTIKSYAPKPLFFASKNHPNKKSSPNSQHSQPRAGEKSAVPPPESLAKSFVKASSSNIPNPEKMAPPIKPSFYTSSFFQKWFGPQSYRASPNFKNRWLMVLPAFLTHLCIGSPWAWSVVVGKFKFNIPKKKKK